MDDDGYDGPAELRSGTRCVPVSVRLTGRFEPITGRYHWYGRVAASPAVADLLSAGVRAVVLHTPHAAVRTTLTDVDPWGRPRVAGSGLAPFPVADRLPEWTE
jgi:Domain of unknown function (DUF4873)